jgi:tellurite resistance protein
MGAKRVLNRLFGDDASVTGPSSPSPEPVTEPEPDPREDLASIRQAISELGSLSVDRRRFLASYAYVLVRMARADGGINDAEVERMEQAVIAAGGLPEAQSALLVALAGRMNSQYGATEDYAVTREFARMSTPQERQRLMRACVAVGVADGVLTGGEAAELYEIGRELGFGADEIDAIRDQVDPHPAESLQPQT